MYALTIDLANCLPLMETSTAELRSSGRKSKSSETSAKGREGTLLIEPVGESRVSLMIALIWKVVARSVLGTNLSKEPWPRPKCLRFTVSEYFETKTYGKEVSELSIRALIVLKEH